MPCRAVPWPVHVARAVPGAVAVRCRAKRRERKCPHNGMGQYGTRAKCPPRSLLFPLRAAHATQAPTKQKRRVRPTDPQSPV